jgi:lipopolysaccharide biosynthesis glycosyltransferase
MKDEVMEEQDIQEVVLEPAFGTRGVAVVWASDSAYAPLMGVSIQSLINNSDPGNNYDLVVLDTGLLPVDRMLLSRMIEGRGNFSMRFIEAEAFIDKSKLRGLYHISVSTYARYLVLDFMKNYEKVLYLDCDLVLNSDAATLFATDLTGHMLGAVRDTVANGWYRMPGHEMKEHLDNVVHIEAEGGYFNAGVLLMNIAEFRKATSCAALMELSASDKWLWLDQDVLNHVCAGRIVYLDQSWNYMAHKETYFAGIPEDHLPTWLHERYLAAREHPRIIHYVGHSSPCFYPQAEFYWYFWQHARGTVFYERLLEMLYDDKAERNRIGTRDVLREMRYTVSTRLAPHGTLRRRIIARLRGHEGE